MAVLNRRNFQKRNLQNTRNGNFKQAVLRNYKKHRVFNIHKGELLARVNLKRARPMIFVAGWFNLTFSYVLPPSTDAPRINTEFQELNATVIFQSIDTTRFYRQSAADTRFKRCRWTEGKALNSLALVVAKSPVMNCGR